MSAELQVISGVMNQLTGLLDNDKIKELIDNPELSYEFLENRVYGMKQVEGVDNCTKTAYYFTIYSEDVKGIENKMYVVLFNIVPNECSPESIVKEVLEIDTYGNILGNIETSFGYKSGVFNEDEIKKMMQDSLSLALYHIKSKIGEGL